jgi:hypothetical protein
MSALRIFIFAISMSVVTGCTYNAQIDATPSFNVVSNYENKISGHWLLFVDSTPLQRPMKPSGMACAAHKFPIDASAPFTSSVNQTLKNLVEEIELVPGPVTPDGIRSRNARGLIVVRGEEVRARLDVKPGFWSADMQSQATVVASVVVNSSAGRLLGTTVEGTANADAEAGAMCSGGADSLGHAVSQAMGDTMRKIGETISNSEKIRNLK